MVTFRRRFTALFAGAAIALTGGLVSAAPAAAAAPDAATIVQQWQTDGPLYVEPRSPIQGAGADKIRDALERSETPMYFAALAPGAADKAGAARLVEALHQELGQESTIGVLAGKDGTGFIGASDFLSGNEISRLAGESKAGGDTAQSVANFVDNANAAMKDGAAEPSAGSGSGGGGSMVLLTLLLLLLAGGLGVFLYSRHAQKQRAEKEARELAMVKQTVDEDVTKLGEEITALDMDVKTAEQTPEMLDDWQRALDSYERAKDEVQRLQRADDVKGVTNALEEGRYGLACVKARVEGRPPPERRAPCFFNPQHGPSVRDVRWAPPGGAARDVPACGPDAERVEAGFDPQTREVLVDGERRPYWDAGPAYAPYASGYFGGFGGVMSMMLMGTMLGSMMGHGMMGMGAYGGDFGGGDYGGDMGDMGGGDFGGGMDFGGFDF